jgi:hypothetical protein
MKPKKKLEAKLFPWKARKPLWEMAKKYKRQKYVLIAVWDYMMWRSGKGNLFELAEELVILDTGMDKDALRWARRTLVAEGWLRKETPRRPSGTREVTRWIVCVPIQQPLGQAVDKDEQQPLQQATVQAAVASTGDCSTGGTVVLQSLDAIASSSSCDATLLQHQVSERVSERVSEPLASLATSPRTLGTKEESNLINLLHGLYGSKRADGAIQISGDIFQRVVMAHRDYRWSDYNCNVMENMLRSSQWKKTATLADFAFRWESQNPNGSLYAQAMRDYDDDGSLDDEGQRENVVEPFAYEPDTDDTVSVPRAETPTPSAAPAAGWELQCERCKRGVRIPPSYGKTVWQCDRTKLGCGALNKVPVDILAQISVSQSKNSEQYFPQAAD